jgi:hypothetical protein
VEVALAVDVDFFVEEVEVAVTQEQALEIAAAE